MDIEIKKLNKEIKALEFDLHATKEEYEVEKNANEELRETNRK